MKNFFLFGIAIALLFVFILFFQSMHPQNEKINALEHERNAEEHQKNAEEHEFNVDQTYAVSNAPLKKPNQHPTEADPLHDSERIVERKYTSDEFQAGINLLVYGHPDMANARQLFKDLSELGFNSLAIAFPLFQDDWQADHVKTDPESTPTIAELTDLIDAAHEQDLSVVLRPILDEQSIISSGHWRGTIQPRNSHAWFESYGTLLLQYAQLSEVTGVKWFNIGTELNSLQSDHAEWIDLIQSIRKIYRGKLMYSFNWNSVNDIRESPFVSQLDYVGIDAYFPLDAPDDATVEMLKASWEIWIDQLSDILRDQTIVVTEAGIIPIAGAYRTPYAWSIPEGQIDWQAQAHYYEATYVSWKPFIDGIYWWNVTLDESTANTIDFSPLGSPTEAVIQKYFLKARYR